MDKTSIVRSDGPGPRDMEREFEHEGSLGQRYASTEVVLVIARSDERQFRHAHQSPRPESDLLGGTRLHRPPSWIYPPARPLRDM